MVSIDFFTLFLSFETLKIKFKDCFSKFYFDRSVKPIRIMMFRSVLFFALLLSASLGHTQNPRLAEAEALQNEGNYAKVEQSLKPLLSQLEAQKSFEQDYVQALQLLSKNYLLQGQAQALINFLAPRLEQQAQNKAFNSNAGAGLYKTLGQAHYALDNYTEALSLMQKTLELHQAHQADEETLGRDYVNLLALCRLQGQYSKMKSYAEAAQKLSKTSEIVQGSLLFEQGNLYRSLGDLTQALSYYQQAEVILDASNATGKLADVQMQKGIIKRSMKEYNLAIKELKKAIFSFRKMEDLNNEVICLIYIADVFQDGLQKADSALFYATEAYNLGKNSPGFTRLLSKSIYGKYLGLSKDPQKGLSLCQEAIQEAIKAEHSAAELINLYQNLSALQAQQNLYAEGLASITQAIGQTLGQAFGPDDALSLSSIQQGENQQIFLDFLLPRRAFFRLKASPTDQAKLKLALQDLLLFDQLTDLSRRDQAQGSKINEADLNKDAYEIALDLCFNLFSLTKDQQYLEQAFYFSQKSKGLALLEAFQGAKATQIAGIPQTVLNEEKAIKLELSSLEQEIFQLKQIPAKKRDKAKIQVKEKALFELQQRYQAFSQKLEKDYPNYYQIKYQLPILKIAEFRSLLKPEQGAIEYFVGDYHVYAFKITAQETQLERNPIPLTFHQDIEKMRKTIYGFYLENSDFANNELYGTYAQSYVEQSHKLYQLLLARLEPLPKRLLVLPDGPLGNIPFEPLLKKPAQDPRRFTEHDYMLKHHIISYSYSASLYREMVQRQNRPSRGFLGFAPSFGEQAYSEIRGKRFALAPLQFNTTEIKGVKKLLGGGTVLEGAAATESAFKEQASQYRILHFATHGMANDEDPDYSLLAFTEVKDSIENEFIYVRDLYDMQLNADLVVLSACETGMGRLYRGEGIMSLARGFSYAGAKSIFTTLWSVNDQAAYEIVEGFYRHLKMGKDKDEALQLAKLDFIGKDDARVASPFFWSPFILIGDVSPIPMNEGQNYLLWGLLAAAVLGLLAYGYRFSRRKTGA